MSGIWCVSMVKDEIDIVEFTIRHLASEGVDGIIVADNGSTDGTFQRLLEIQPELDCYLIIVNDPDPAYYQARKMTELAERAVSMGAKWVLPFDADELWYVDDTQSIDEYLRFEPPAILKAQVHNYFGCDGDPADACPFRSIIHRDALAAPLPKVMAPAVAGLQIHQGNHGAGYPGQDRAPEPSRLMVAHFPWRTYDQFESKVRNGAAAYAATNLPADTGAHWRQYGDILEHQGPDALRELFETWFRNPQEVSLERHEAPYLRWQVDHIIDP